MRKRTALAVIAAAAALDVALGVLFAFAEGIPVPAGIYFATVTATTAGYGDIVPHGWASHVVAVAIMVTVIPMFGASFSLFTAGLSEVHLHRAHAEAAAARKIAADTYRHVTGTDHPDGV